MKKLEDILRETDIISISGKTDRLISGIQYDSRKCLGGTLFVALRGTLTDGHNYIQKAIELGAVSLVCEVLPSILHEDITYIQVKNSRKTLAKLSHNWYDNPTDGLNIIGVTGTNGKTTITFLFKQIFRELGEEIGIIGTTGIFIGENKMPATHTTPESLELAEIFGQMKQSGIKTVVMEVSSHALVQHRADGIRFSAALFTNLTQDHLDYHKTFDEYAKAKKILFDMLEENSLAIVFDNSPFTDLMLKDTKAKRKLIISRSDKADLTISNENIAVNGNSFTLRINQKEFNFISRLTGKFNIDNASIATSWFLLNEYDFANLKPALAKAEGAPGRMQRIELKSGAIAFVDYAHTPDALEKALLTCREILKASGDNNCRLISVFGCGGDRDAGKRPIMGDISLKIADYSIITSDNPRTEEPLKIIQDIIINFPEKTENYAIIPDRRDAIGKSVESANKGDIILLAGKGHEDYQIIGREKHYFDDAKELESYK